MTFVIFLIITAWMLSPLLNKIQWTPRNRVIVKYIKEVKPELPTKPVEFRDKRMVSSTSDEIESWLRKNPDLKIHRDTE